MNEGRTRVSLPIGKRIEQVGIPNLLATVRPHDIPGLENPEEAVSHALDNPVGTPPLATLAAGRRDAVIIINDNTRPYPAYLLVKAIAARLNAAGLPDEKITLLVACGVHAPNTREEMIAAYGREMVDRFRIVTHNALDDANLVTVGCTDCGTAVCINKLFVQADLKISTGLIAPHHSAGYSGGRKSVIPGIAGMQTLKKHHSIPIRPFDASMGFLDGNPFHEEALKSARIAGLEFIVNVVVNARKEVTAVVAGEVDAAHRLGVTHCEKIWRVTIPQKADVVVTSPGGYPRDIDLRQAQKAISCAEPMCKPGGTIILFAEATQGVGPFGRYLKEARSPQEVIDTYIRDGFSPDANAKAFHFARALTRYTVVIAGSVIAKAELEDMFMTAADDIQTAVDAAYAAGGPGTTFLVAPIAYGLVVDQENSIA